MTAIDWEFTWRVEKQDLDGNVLEVVHVDGNGLTALGKLQVLAMILGTGTTDFGTDPYLAVGDSALAFDPAQTALQGTKQQDASAAVTSGSSQITWNGLMAGQTGGLDWREFAVFDQQPIAATNAITDFYWGVQNGDPSDPDSGTFDIFIPGLGTFSFPFDAASNGAPALQALWDAYLGAGNTFIDATTEVGFFTLEMTGAYAAAPWSPMTIDTTNLGGPDAPYSGSPDEIAPGTAETGLMLNRKVANLGNQPNFQNWRLFATAKLVG